MRDILLLLDISGIKVYNTVHGAEFKLDVGLYRLDQQVACQRGAYLMVFHVAEIDLSLGETDFFD